MRTGRLIALAAVVSIDGVGKILAEGGLCHTFTVSPLTSEPRIAPGDDIWRGPLYVGTPDGRMRSIRR